MSFHHIYLIDWMHSYMIIKKKQQRFSRQTTHIYWNCFGSRYVCVCVCRHISIYCEHRLRTHKLHTMICVHLWKHESCFFALKQRFFRAPFPCKSILLWQTCITNWYIMLKRKNDDIDDIVWRHSKVAQIRHWTLLKCIVNDLFYFSLHVFVIVESSWFISTFRRNCSKTIATVVCKRNVFYFYFICLPLLIVSINVSISMWKWHHRVNKLWITRDEKCSMQLMASHWCTPLY